MTPKNWILYPDEAGSPGDGEPWLLWGWQEAEVTQKGVGWGFCWSLGSTSRNTM